MKKFFTLSILFILSLIGFNSCAKLEQPESVVMNITDEVSALTITPSTVQINASGTPVEIKVTGAEGAMGCTLTNAIGKWISVDVKKGSVKGEYTLTVAATANTGNARSLRCGVSDGRELAWLTINQAANN